MLTSRIHASSRRNIIRLTTSHVLELLPAWLLLLRRRPFVVIPLTFTLQSVWVPSPGNPSQPTSLHYMSPYQMNAYAMALKAVGEIIQDYDSDKLFPAYGFGAKLPPDGKISHAFPLVGL